MQDSLYVIRSEIGNQCSALWSGLVCSCREDLRINLADAFWIFWSENIVHNYHLLTDPCGCVCVFVCVPCVCVCVCVHACMHA